MRTIPTQPRRRRLESEGGFTLVEFMVAALITTLVLGGTVALATQIQSSYGTQLDDTVVEQEARYALDWIARDLRSAASDPYDAILDDQELFLAATSIRVQADINPPDGDIADPGENVIITFAANAITREDTNLDPEPAVMTDAIFTDLQFTYLNAAGVETADSELVAYIRVQVTAQSRALNPNTQEYPTSTLATEVRLRTR